MSATVFWWSGFFIALCGGAVAVWALLVAGRAKGRLRCPRCWYDMAGAVVDEAGAHTCPECGRGIVKAGRMMRTRRFWKLAVLGVLLIVAGVGTWATPMLRAQKWQRRAPSTLLVMLADADGFLPVSETWSELFTRLNYGQLSARHRTVLCERLAQRISVDNPISGKSLDALNLMKEFRPGRSAALAERMTMFITAWETRRERGPDDNDEEWLSHDYYHVVAIGILSRVGSESDLETVSASVRRAPWNPIRFSTALALGRIGGDAAIDVLIEIVADEKDRVAITAAVALALINEPARERAEAAITLRLARTDGDQQRDVLTACVSVLRGEEAHISIPLLRLYVERTGVEQRGRDHLAEQYFYILGADAAPSVPLVMAYLDDEDPGRVERALIAIELIGSAAGEALPMLDEMAARSGSNRQLGFSIRRLRRPN